MGSLYKQYMESKGFGVYETEKGFMSYIIHKNILMVQDFYVKPEFQGTWEAWKLTKQVEKIAIEKGCTDFAAEIYKTDPLFEYILKLHHWFGMVEIENNEFKVITSKKLGVLNDQPTCVISNNQ